MYDIFGDIHGHAGELESLLAKLGYRETNGAYRHSSRQAVFVGDLIDRGPQIPRVLNVVRAMHEEGSALVAMGNHEFNALAFSTEDPGSPGRYLRPHSKRNLQQHGATLAQIIPADWHSHLNWFRSLPMWLSLDGIRVVHACWDEAEIQILREQLELQGGVDTEFLLRATDPDHSLFDAVETVLKGKEISLPEGSYYLDKDGHRRTRTRTQWFRSPAGESYASYSMPANDSLPDSPLPVESRLWCVPYPENASPVFFGHYWLRAETPTRLAANVACLDFSVAKGGCLCAYRWDGEDTLRDEAFTTVRAGSS